MDYPIIEYDSTGIPITHFAFDVISTIRSDAVLLNSVENNAMNRIPADDSMEWTFGNPIQFYMLRYHQDRLVAAGNAWGWDTSPISGTIGFEKLLDVLHTYLEKEYNDRFYSAPLKLRIEFSASLLLSVTSDGFHPEPATIDRTSNIPLLESVAQLYPTSLFIIADHTFSSLYLHWQVLVTAARVEPNKHTRHKTSDREIYDRALGVLRFLPKQQQPILFTQDGVELQTEVLVVNTRDEIMEGCKTTPYFLRDNKWITPARECGGNLGTTRRWALEKGLCEEGVVKADSVKENEIVVLSNGVRGFQAGIVRPWPT